MLPKFKVTIKDFMVKLSFQSDRAKSEKGSKILKM